MRSMKCHRCFRIWQILNKAVRSTHPASPETANTRLNDAERSNQMLLMRPKITRLQRISWTLAPQSLRAAKREEEPTRAHEVALLVTPIGLSSKTRATRWMLSSPMMGQVMVQNGERRAIKPRGSQSSVAFSICVKWQWPAWQQIWSSGSWVSTSLFHTPAPSRRTGTF